MSSGDRNLARDIPAILNDASTNTVYQSGRFYGKGSFAKCYEIINAETKQSFACKVVPKRLIGKSSQMEQLLMEIQIQKALHSPFVVAYHNFFEDSLNVYIVLELCTQRSLMELQKRRKSLTEPECRFYIKDILLGVQYLHDMKIIHRDLKLGNLFLNENLHVKIGDFGLAAKIEYAGEKKKTLCGTPNYLAPEMLNNVGHSIEVDIWSIGCIMYTLLVGKPPFESETLDETYKKIQSNDYTVPKFVDLIAKRMIITMLHPRPDRRPNATALLEHEFFTSGFLPTQLPVSSLTMAPRFDHVDCTSVPVTWKPLLHANTNANDNVMETDSSVRSAHHKVGTYSNDERNIQQNENLSVLWDLLDHLLKKKKRFSCENLECTVEQTDPAAQPLIWVSKWVDYSQKYGFGYQLCDDSTGMVFNDDTKIILFSNGINVHYTAKDGTESYMFVDDYPKSLEKKFKLMADFNRYMSEHLVKAGADVVRDVDELSRKPQMHQWCRSNSAVVMHLTNGTVQINFLDHTKIILCPWMNAVTWSDGTNSFRTYRFSTLEKVGCPKALYKNLVYAHEKITVLLEKN